MRVWNSQNAKIERLAGYVLHEWWVIDIRVKIEMHVHVPVETISGMHVSAETN